MLSRLAFSITTFALALTAHGSISGWSPAALAAPVEHKNCTAKKHRHGKVAAAKPATRGSGGAQIRRLPDVQILTFGP
jgi:hypothetical protein